MASSNKSISYPSVSRRRIMKKLNRQRLFGSPRANRFYANDTSAYVPEQWAQESVRVLVENMRMANTVHRDFSPMVAEYGEIVHTRKPSEFDASRKQNDLDNVSDSDVTATKIAVALNQRAYVSFLIGDGEKSKAFKDLFTIYLEPAMQAEARFLDRVLACESYQFLDNLAGGLGQLDKNNAHDYLLDAREVMNNNKVGEENRWMALASNSETEMQKTDLFKSAERVGDGGTALERAILGMKAGWNNFLELNMPSVRAATTATTTTTSAAGLAGASTVSVTSSSNLSFGTYFTIAGDYSPLRVGSVAGTSPIVVTLSKRNLWKAVASGAVIQPYANGAINQASPIAAGDTTAAVNDGYPAGWMKAINVDGTGVPHVGQLVAFSLVSGSTVKTAEYGIVRVDPVSSTYDIYLDRPLEDTLANNDIVNYGPNGDFNLGYQREAIALVNRPLALPEAGTGARAAAAVLNGMSMRVVMTYDGLKQATRVTVDALFGKKQLDADRGVVLLG